jgi:hypothetical protein
MCIIGVGVIFGGSVGENGGKGVAAKAWRDTAGRNCTYRSRYGERLVI